MKRVMWWIGMASCIVLLAGCAGSSGSDAQRQKINQMPTQTPTVTPTPQLGQWRLVPNPAATTSSNSRLISVAALSAANVWAVGGIYDTPTNSDIPLLMQYDGQQWNMISTSFVRKGTLTALAATSDHDMWAAGNYQPQSTSSYQPFFVHYDGQQWAMVPGPSTGVPASLNCITAIAPNEVWAAGFTQPNGAASVLEQPLAEHFNGTQWQIVPTADLGSNGGAFLSIKEIAADDIWAVGITPNTVLGGWDPLIEHYDGARWSVVTGASEGRAYLNAVTATSSHDVWIAGISYSEEAGPAQQTDGLVEHYDGTRWTVVPTAELPNPASGFSVIAAASPNDVWVVGHATNMSSQVLAAHWDGTHWKELTAPSPTSYTNSVFGISLLSPSEAWVVGMSTFSQSGPVQATILHYAP